MNPGNKETVDVVSNNFIDTIIARHMPQQVEKEKETNIEQVRAILINEVVGALSLFQLYEEQQESSDGGLNQHLWSEALALTIMK